MNKFLPHALLIAVLLLFICPVSHAAGPVTEVLAVGPAWNKFTQTDGKGLYHDILREVFGLYGIKVRREYMPSPRAEKLIAEGQADFMTCTATAPSNLTLARYPMFENKYHVFYNNKRFPDWNGRQTLDGKRLAWRIGYYVPSEFRDISFTYKEYTSGVQALEMVVRGRMDFYVEDINFIKDSMRTTETRFNKNEFSIKPVGTRTYHPIFNNSERGRRIMKLYDDGMKMLHESGRLKEIFDKWGFDCPDYDNIHSSTAARLT